MKRQWIYCIDYLSISELGENNRTTGLTAANHNSSRSHTIFRIQFHLRPKKMNMKTYSSILNLIDLAGSEGVSKAKTEGIR